MSKGAHAQCHDIYAPLRAVKRCIREGHSVMILMRGVPGSGKSYLASELCSLCEDGVIYSTDDFFNQNGKYEFDPQKLEEYHKNNIIRARDAMKDDKKPIIIDNTNIQTIHLKQYVQHAVTYFYEVFIVEPESGWKYKAGECFRRNQHGVSKEKILRMLDLLDAEGKPSLQSLVGKDKSVSIIPPFDDSFEESEPKSCSAGNVSSLTGDTTPSLLSTQDIIPGKGLNSKFSFSLAHSIIPSTLKVSVRDVGIQTTEVSIVLGSAGIDTIEDDVIADPERQIERSLNSRPETKERPSPLRCDYSPSSLVTSSSNSQMDLLVSIFPEESMGQLWHFFQLLGLVRTIQLFHEKGSYIKHNAIVDEGAFVVEVAVSELSGSSKREKNTEISTKDSSRNSFQVGGRLGNYGASKSCENEKTWGLVSDVLPHSTTGSGLVDVSLGSDLVGLLEVMFGEPGELFDKATVPVWLLHQLYLSCKGETVTPQSVYLNEFPKPEENLANDAEIARIMQEQEDANSRRNREMDGAQRMQLKYLIQEFSSVDANRVAEVFEDSNYNATDAHGTLRLLLNDDDFSPPPLSSGAATPQPIIIPSVAPNSPKPSQSCGSMRSVSSQSRFAAAQAHARELQRSAEEWAEKKSEELRKAARYHNASKPMNTAGAVYSLNARRYGEKERELREQAAQLMIAANEKSEYLDLHLMNRGDAIKTLKKRLGEIDRSPELQKQGRSTRRLSVITGYGKTSGRAVIKPAVENWLLKNSYRFSHANQGEVIVEGK